MRRTLPGGGTKGFGRGLESQIDSKRTMRSGWEYGSGSSKTALMTEKIAVFAPTPSPSVRTATVVKPGERRRVRMA